MASMLRLKYSSIPQKDIDPLDLQIISDLSFLQLFMMNYLVL